MKINTVMGSVFLCFWAIIAIEHGLDAAHEHIRLAVLICANIWFATS